MHIADGSLFLCTAMDPLFPLLPILEKARNKVGVECEEREREREREKPVTE
jgi:hypothetical protein